MGCVSPNTCVYAGGSSSRALCWCELLQRGVLVLSVLTGTHTCETHPPCVTWAVCVVYMSVSWHVHGGDMCDVCM